MSWRNVYRERPELGENRMLKVLGALEAGATEALAAQIGGVSERALRYMKEADPELREAIENSKRIADGQVRQSLFKNAVKSNNVAAQIFYLKNRLGWADRTHIAGSIDHNILPKLVDSTMNDPVLEAKVVKQLEPAARQALSEARKEPESVVARTS